MRKMPIDIGRVRELKRQEAERRAAKRRAPKSPPARSTFCRPAGPEPEDSTPAFEGLDDELRRRRDEPARQPPPRVAIDLEARERYEEFANGVVRWVEGPTPKITELRASLDIANGIDGAVLGVVVTLRAVFGSGSDRMEYGIERWFEGERINGNTYPPRPPLPLYPPGHLQESLEAMHSELAAFIRDQVGPPSDGSDPSSAGSVRADVLPGERDAERRP
jgi:hypothetical protein